eukprot:8347158-Karenia_brevis.AAC.1
MKQLKKMNTNLPGFASEKEWIDLDHALSMSVEWGTDRFVSRSTLKFGKTDEVAYPEDPDSRSGMLCITDMHAPIGNSIGWASAHFRIDGLYEPIHRLHDSNLNGLKRCGGWQ